MVRKVVRFKFDLDELVRRKSDGLVGRVRVRTDYPALRSYTLANPKYHWTDSLPDGDDHCEDAFEDELESASKEDVW